MYYIGGSREIEKSFEIEKKKGGRKKMKKVKMAEVEKMAKEFDMDVEKVKLELKRIQSAKCRLKKMKFKSSYESEMEKVVCYEDLLKEVKRYIVPQGKFVTDFEREDVEKLSYDEVIRALRSIQSKKCLSKYKVEKIEDNVEYNRACEVEGWLKKKRDSMDSKEDGKVNKMDVMKVIELIENSGEIEVEKIVKELKEIIE